MLRNNGADQRPVSFAIVLILDWWNIVRSKRLHFSKSPVLKKNAFVWPLCVGRRLTDWNLSIWMQWNRCRDWTCCLEFSAYNITRLGILHFKNHKSTNSNFECIGQAFSLYFVFVWITPVVCRYGRWWRCGSKSWWLRLLLDQEEPGSKEQ